MVRRVVLAAYTAILLALLLAPSVPGPVSAYDKLGHVVLFAGFAFLFWWSTRFDPWVRIAFAFAAGVALGLLTEALQSFIPGRSAEWGDLLGDVVGSCVGVGAAMVWHSGGKASS